jgi:hypothetical protein
MSLLPRRNKFQNKADETESENDFVDGKNG